MTLNRCVGSHHPHPSQRASKHPKLPLRLPSLRTGRRTLRLGVRGFGYTSTRARGVASRLFIYAPILGGICDPIIPIPSF